MLNDQVSLPVFWIIKSLFLLGFVVAMWPLHKFASPLHKEVLRRIEIKSDLENRPLIGQKDEMALGRSDSLAAALWREHQHRLKSGLDNLTSGTPKPRANLFDPFAVRAMLPLLAMAAFFYSYSPNGGRLGDILFSDLSVDEVESRMDAWINPPAYTKASPIYLSSNSSDLQGQPINVPTNSEFFLRFVGSADIQLIQSGSAGDIAVDRNDAENKPGELEYSLKLQQDSIMRLESRGDVLAQWDIKTAPDKAPSIAFAEKPKAALSGSLQLSYQVEDDYGVTKAEGAVSSLAELDPEARALVNAPKLVLSLPRHRAKSGSSRVNRDLTEHPWAGSEVTITLLAHDDAGQVGRSETVTMVLPGRRFSKPLARALVEQRRILALDARKQYHVANMLDAVMTGPEGFIEAGSFIAMNVAYRRIVSARQDTELRDAVDLLWEIALAIEFGDLSEAERRLREAQEALSQALEEGASQEQIDQLMKELRQAMNEMMQAMIEEARRNPQSQGPINPHEQSQTLTQQDLQRMMDRIEDLAKSGSQDAARELLSELQRMMDNLRAGRHQQQRRAEGNEMNKALDELSELMRRQQELMDQTFEMQRRQERLGRNQGNSRGQDQQQQSQPGQQQQSGNQQGGSEQGQQGGTNQMTPEEFAEALKRLQQQQESLQRQLGKLNKQLEELGVNPGEQFDEAGRQMGKAGANLGDGNTGQAGSNQGQAMDALRQGAQSMLEQMAGDRQQGGRQQGNRGGEGDEQMQQSSDPLGRRYGRDGGMDSESGVEIPGVIDAQRAREIMEAIRKRLAIPDSPLIEEQYLERLLKNR